MLYIMLGLIFFEGNQLYIDILLCSELRFITYNKCEKLPRSKLIFSISVTHDPPSKINDPNTIKYKSEKDFQVLKTEITTKIFFC